MYCAMIRYSLYASLENQLKSVNIINQNKTPVLTITRCHPFFVNLKKTLLIHFLIWDSSLLGLVSIKNKLSIVFDRSV